MGQWLGENDARKRLVFFEHQFSFGNVNLIRLKPERWLAFICSKTLVWICTVFSSSWKYVQKAKINLQDSRGDSDIIKLMLQFHLEF